MNDKDRLGRRAIAQKLAEDIFNLFEASKNISNDSNASDPLSKSYSIAIQGSWGEGKTFFIDLLKEELQKQKDKIEIKEFNPWYFPDECNLHQQLLSLLDNSSRENWLKYFYTFFIILIALSFSEDYFKQLLNIKFIQWIFYYGYKIVENLKITWFPCLIFILFLKFDSFIPLIVNLIKLSNSNSLFDLISISKKNKFDYVEVEKDLKKITKGRRLLVILDNIDRLSSLQIKKILDLIKGAGDLPNIVYILAFDKQIVAKAVNKEDIEEGLRYLDKFVQRQETLKYSYEEIIKRDLEKEFPGKKDDISRCYKALSQYNNNIRELKNLIDSFKPKYEILKDNLKFEQLLLLTAIAIKDFEIFRFLHESKNILCHGKSPTKFIELLEEKINKRNENREGLRAIIIQIFPCIKESADLKSQKELSIVKMEPIYKCINNPEYFDIYFTSLFPDDLLRDSERDELLQLSNDKHRLSNHIMKLLGFELKETRQKIPNRISDPYKWLNSLTVFLNQDKNIDFLHNWLFAIAAVVEKLVTNSCKRAQEYSSYNSFEYNFKKLLDTTNPAQDEQTTPIFLFFMDTDRINQEQQFREIVTSNIKLYAQKNKLVKLPYYQDLILNIRKLVEDKADIVDIIISDLLNYSRQNHKILDLPTMQGPDPSPLNLIIYLCRENQNRANVSDIVDIITSELLDYSRQNHKIFDLPFLEEVIECFGPELDQSHTNQNPERNSFGKNPKEFIDIIKNEIKQNDDCFLHFIEYAINRGRYLQLIKIYISCEEALKRLEGLDKSLYRQKNLQHRRKPHYTSNPLHIDWLKPSLKKEIAPNN